MERSFLSRNSLRYWTSGASSDPYAAEATRQPVIRLVVTVRVVVTVGGVVVVVVVVVEVVVVVVSEVVVVVVVSVVEVVKTVVGPVWKDIGPFPVKPRGFGPRAAP